VVSARLFKCRQAGASQLIFEIKINGADSGSSNITKLRQLKLATGLPFSPCTRDNFFEGLRAL
jgi:hypothetical protein